MLLIIYRCLFVICLFYASTLVAQHEHSVDHSTHTSMEEDSLSVMSHAFSLQLPMRRNGSGTGWLPDSTPMYGYMLHRKKWMFMFHGNVFARYTQTDIFKAGSRGAEKADAINWVMGMGQRRIGKRGLFRFSVMMSLDNLFGGNGYPLLFQTGETWQGQPLVDRQHPHDLFSELSIGYTHAVSKKTDVFIYLGYPGEPALGSVAFMHRVSSLYGPDAPLSHHWNDGTHITFGVITAGIRYQKFKFELSDFTGREPDENRYDFDRIRMDSYSARVSYNPNAFWSFQVSQGFVRSPEVTRPEEDVLRSTASAVYSRPISAQRFFNMTVLWGMNNSHAAEHAALAEAVIVMKRVSVFSRYEFVQKSADELNLQTTKFDEHETFDIHALTLGSSFNFLNSRYGKMDLGAQGSVYLSDRLLEGLYGRTPLSAQIFLRFYPPRMQ